MEHVSNITEPNYYGIFVISESRLYRVCRTCAGFNHINTYKNTYSQSIPYQNYTNGVIPSIDTLLNNLNVVTNSIISKFIILDSIIDNIISSESYFITKGKELELCEAQSTFNNVIKIPMFTDPNKLTHFLSMFLYNETSYFECESSGKPILRAREELSVVKLSRDEINTLSETFPILINPTRAFF